MTNDYREEGFRIQVQYFFFTISFINFSHQNHQINDEDILKTEVEKKNENRPNHSGRKISKKLKTKKISFRNRNSSFRKSLGNYF